MKRLAHWSITLVLLLSVVLSACGTPQKTTTSPSQQSPAPAAPKPAATAPQLTGNQALVEAAKKEGELIIWSNTWQAGKIENAFKELYPFLKVTVWDGPVGTTLVSRIIEEGKAGKTSVDFVSLSAEDMPALVAAGLLKEYDWPNLKGVPGQPPHKFYVNHSVTTRAPVYNTKLVSAADAPKSWDGLKSSRWAGKSIMSTSGTDSPLMFAYMWRDGDKLNWDKATSFWKDVRTVTRPQIASGMGVNADLLAAGEYDIMLLVSLGEIMIRIWKGAPLQIASVGKLTATARSAGILKNAPHPATAQLFADFFTQPKMLATYSDMLAVLSLSPEANKLSKTGAAYKAAGLEVEVIPPEFATEANLLKAQDIWRDVTKLR